MFWNAQTVESSSFDDGGLWVVSRHADVKFISCARSGWSSEENTAIPEFDGRTVGYQERQEHVDRLDPAGLRMREVRAR